MAQQALSATYCQGATGDCSGTGALDQLLEWAGGRFDKDYAVLTSADAQYIADTVLSLAPHQQTEALLAVSGLVSR